MIHIFQSEEECSFTIRKMGIQMLRKAYLIAYKLHNGSYKVLRSKLSYCSTTEDNSISHSVLQNLTSNTFFEFNN